MSFLSAQVAIVTDSSRGVGRGIALQLAAQGATVITTGRLPEASVRKEYLASNINKRFYKSDPELWDKNNVVGLQNHYYCAVYATRMMISQGRGLIVNLFSFGGLFYLFNAPYGIGKAGLDRMTREMVVQLQEAKITVVSLYPKYPWKRFSRAWRIKNVFKGGETPDFVGQAVAALASDPKRHKMNGKILLTVDLARKYGFREQNGRLPPNLRSLKHHLLALQGNLMAKWTPEYLLCPGWLLWLGGNML